MSACRRFETIRFYMDAKLSLAISSLIHVLEPFAFAWIQNKTEAITLKAGVLEPSIFTWVQNTSVTSLVLFRV